jgi:hypothetical protein
LFGRINFLISEIKLTLLEYNRFTYIENLSINKQKYFSIDDLVHNDQLHSTFKNNTTLINTSDNNLQNVMKSISCIKEKIGILKAGAKTYPKMYKTCEGNLRFIVHP